LFSGQADSAGSGSLGHLQTLNKEPLFAFHYYRQFMGVIVFVSRGTDFDFALLVHTLSFAMKQREVAIWSLLLWSQGTGE